MSLGETVTVAGNSIIGFGMLALALWRSWCIPAALRHDSPWVVVYTIGGALIGYGIAIRVLPWNAAILMADDSARYASWVWPARPYFTMAGALLLAAGCALLIAGERRSRWIREAPVLACLWVVLFGGLGLMTATRTIALPDVALAGIACLVLAWLWYLGKARE